jgi:CheY-like chemotaxis protein
MTVEHARTLIVTGPGSLHNGLTAIAAAMPQTHPVVTAEETHTAQRVIAEHHPALVLLDMALPGDGAQVVLQQIRTACPATWSIALASDVRQQQEAELAGVDAVLIKGFPPTRLIAIIEDLLSTERAGSDEHTSRSCG